MNLKKEKRNKSNNSLAKILLRGKIISGFVSAIFLLAFCILVAPTTLRAQTATVYGQLSNFDVINHTEHEAHGFEIELEGIQPVEVPYYFSVERYGAPQIVATPTGTAVRWTSAYANGAFAQTTLAHAPNTPFAGSCYQWGANYNGSACEHFGVSLAARPIKTTYRWLIEDANNPGTLVGFDPPIAIVSPIYVISPPPAPGATPVLEAQIEAPEAAESPDVYGDAQWVKVFKTQLNREANLDELVTDNAVVPQGAANVEVAWEIVQVEPVSNSNSNGNRQHRANQTPLSFDTRSVLRRYETYQYTGAYDAVSHEALCADTLCNAPSAGELGEFIAAQMVAVNVVVNSISVTRTGSGTVSSSDKLIGCGNKCSAGYNQGAVITLTASPTSGSVFTGWGGACGGNALTCTITVNNALNVSANFAVPINISAKTSGKGAVKAPSVGIDCGKNCSARITSPASVTFTATPDAGFRFINWTGACSGTALSCTTAIGKDALVQANFAK